MVEGPALARELLDYDLWFTHADASGRTLTRHATSTGMQGQAVGFRFRPVHWPLQRLAPSAAADLSIDEHAAGTLRGRERIHGPDDVLLAATRSPRHTSPRGPWG